MGMAKVSWKNAMMSDRGALTNTSSVKCLISSILNGWTAWKLVWSETEALNSFQCSRISARTLSSGYSMLSSRCIWSVICSWGSREIMARRWNGQTIEGSFFWSQNPFTSGMSLSPGWCSYLSRSSMNLVCSFSLSGPWYQLVAIIRLYPNRLWVLRYSTQSSPSLVRCNTWPLRIIRESKEPAFFHSPSSWRNSRSEATSWTLTPWV